MKPGKLAAMVGHCCEAYWTNLLKAGKIKDNEFATLSAEDPAYPGRPALYKHPLVYAASKAAFEAGQKSFKYLEEQPKKTVTVSVEIPKDIWNDYVNDIFTKTICECRNLNQLNKAAELAKEQGLVEGVDYGFINDRCLTDLAPENENGTCTIGIWFRPLPDDIAHAVSKKFQLYKE